MRVSRGRSRSASSDAGPARCTHHEDSESSADEMPLPHLFQLKTKAESRAQADTLQAWTVELPVQAANDILLLCKELIPDQDSIDLQHLRRFAKPDSLPLNLAGLSISSSRSSSIDSKTSSDVSSNGLSKSQSRSRSRRRRKKPSIMHLLVCSTSLISHDDLTTLLQDQAPFSAGLFALKIREVTVPMLAPTSAEQAKQWSAQYWPTLYRKTNPFGPHPSLVTRAEDDLMADDRVDRCMLLAQQAGHESKDKQLGIGTGCVVVERAPGKGTQIIAVAADARFHNQLGTSEEKTSCSGNVMTHAVIRAIGMVARKRVRVASPKSPSERSASDKLLVTPVAHAADTPAGVDKLLLDYPLTDTEQTAFDKDNIVPNGYLCVDLEIYLTHEPCLMCSMAIVHSRFGRCVFGHRMPATGGFAGDAGLGYGLFWRSELNWKLLCWEWRQQEQGEQNKLDEQLQI